jgi:hypothetical protein
MKKIIFLYITFLIISLSSPLINTENNVNNTEPEFEVGF